MKQFFILILVLLKFSEVPALPPPLFKILRTLLIKCLSNIVTFNEDPLPMATPCVYKIIYSSVFLENAEASAERISFIPNDDEEIDNEIDQQLQSEVNTRTQKTPKMENEKLMHKTTESEIETLTQKTIEVETTETTESNLPKVLKIIKHSSINSRTIPTLWQNKRTTSPKSDQTINLVLLGIVSAFFVWLLIVTILLVTLYRKFIDSRKRKKTLICSSNYFQGSLSEKDV